MFAGLVVLEHFFMHFAIILETLHACRRLAGAQACKVSATVMGSILTEGR